MKTNIMNLMMGTKGLENTAGAAMEVDGELFSALLQKVTGQGGIEPEAVFDQSGAEAVEKEDVSCSAGHTENEKGRAELLIGGERGIWNEKSGCGAAGTKEWTGYDP